jgi:siroheme synthase-like protein
VAISTGGRAPALAGLLREALERLLPDTLSDWVTFAERLRERWRDEGVPMEERRPLLLRALDQRYGRMG